MEFIVTDDVKTHRSEVLDAVLPVKQAHGNKDLRSDAVALPLLHNALISNNKHNINPKPGISPHILIDTTADFFNKSRNEDNTAEDIFYQLSENWAGIR